MTKQTKPSRILADLTVNAVANQCEVTEREVTGKVECAGCGQCVEEIARSYRLVKKQLAERCKGWGRVFDWEVNDGMYSYCPTCIKSMFPNLQARLRADVLGKPLPPIDRGRGPVEE